MTPSLQIPALTAELRPPKVSILITAFNAARFIRASVTAALSQSYPNFEVLVIDDGSSDATGDTCVSIHDSRFRYIRRERIGRRRALNEGIDLAEGEYVAINDADDLSFPTRLARCVEAFAGAPDMSFIGTAFATTEEFSESIPSSVLIDAAQIPARVTKLSPLRLYRSNPLINSTVMFSKRIWTALGGYDETLSNCEDYDFFLRALTYGDAGWLATPTVLWYTNPTSFFKSISAVEYWRALTFIKRRAHRNLNLPMWARVYGGLDLYQAAKSGLFQWQIRSMPRGARNGRDISDVDG